MKKKLFWAGMFLLELLAFLFILFFSRIFGYVMYNPLYEFFEQPWWLLVPEFILMAYAIFCLLYKKGKIAKRYFDQALKNV